MKFNKLKILVIEDDHDAFILMQGLLQKIGFQRQHILHATGITNLKKHIAENVDIIISDLSLPDSSYNETIERVKVVFPHKPVIAVTANADESFGLIAIHQGAQDYLLKTDLTPFNLTKSIQYSIEREKTRGSLIRMFEESPAPMFIFQEETQKLVAVNNAALQQYGYSKSELLSMNVNQIRHPDDAEKIAAAISNVDTGFNDIGRWRHRNKAGKEFYVNLYSHDSVFEGEPVKIVLALNIDKNVKAELALQQKNNEIQNIFQSITDGFFAVDTEWKFSFINSEGEVLLHKKKEELLGKNIWELFPEAVNLDFYKEYHRAVKENVSVHFEEYYPPIDKWFSVNAYPSENGLSVYFLDITEQFLLRERLSSYNQNLKAIINNTSDIIWSIGKDLQIITANNAFWKRVEAITGINPKDLTAESFDPAVFDTWKAYFDQAFNGAAFKVVRKEIFKGTEIYAEISFNPIRDENDNVVGISCFARDITKQQQHLNMIESQYKQLKKIAWIQSHEVRRPVANILGLVDLFNTENLSDPANIQIIHHLKESAEMMDDIIKNITQNTTDILNSTS